MRSHLTLSIGLTLAAQLAAQAPELRVTPVVRPGESVDLVLFGRPLAAYATLFDFDGGPVQFMGADFFLGFTPGLGVLDSGTIGIAGFRTAQIPTGRGPLDLPLYLQSIVLEPGPAFVFRTTDGESTLIANAPFLIVEDFDDPIAQGLTGDFDASVRGRIEAAMPRRRVQNVPPPGGALFNQPISGPLNALGVRMQMVVRAGDLGASGVPEYVTGIRWMPYQNAVLQPDRFFNMAIDLAHSFVVPDYTIDPFTALPRFPNSGLALVFQQNVAGGSIPQRVFQGDYAIDPVQRQADGYMPFPSIRPFLYDGVRSLLIDFRTPPDPRSLGLNGLAGYLMVMSSPQPNSRVLAAGNPIFGPPRVDPYTTTVALTGDNFYFDMQVELTRTRSTALSRWIHAQGASPQYLAPVVSASVPTGTTMSLHYRGADDPLGLTATPWAGAPQAVSGHAYLQYMVVFDAALSGRARPSIDQIVIPYQ